ncbi:protein 33K [Human adenovirus 12]|nr:protein 33K [Human adenovirus 12]WOR02140.1 protein 33K [Human adenovirus 12]WOR02169.1 protein 33K [Human adenovirus 12]WOR02281.1 protein 33K [Human adenovirus 12]WRT27759.1 protein 33K [Human adenovirus 12]
MSPKAAKQAIAQQRSKKQQQRQEIWEEESWESQAEDEVEDLEEWEEEEADSLDEDPEEEEGSKDGATAAKPSLSTKPSPMKPAVSKSQKASRRWDTIETSAANLAPLKSSTRNRPATAKRPTRIGNSSNKESPEARELRKRIFPTLYAIFQQSRGQEHELKIKNRSLRSLTRSCLYLKSEDQLQRTLQDAEALFNKYCSLSLKE